MPQRIGGYGRLARFPLASPRKAMVVLTSATLVAAFGAAGLAWSMDEVSLIRLFHWWLVFVQGNDSWMPMRAAYDWHASGHADTIYRHVLFGEHIKFQYPPASLLVFAVPEALHVPVTDRVLNMIGWLSVAVQAAATGALALLATRDWPEQRLRYAAAALAFVAALSFYPVLWAYREGQIQTWLTAWFALAAVCFFCGRMRLAGALIGAMCIAKPQFLLFLVWALLRGQWKFASGMAAVLALTFAASFYVFGWDNHVDYLAALSYMSHHGEAFVRNYSVNGIMHRLLGNGYNLEFQHHDYAPYNPLVYWTTLTSSAAFIGFTLFFRRREQVNLIDLFIAGLSLTMASPIAWEHHYGLLAPIFLILAVTMARSAPEHRSIAPVITLIAAFLACDIILPPIAALSTGLASLLQSTVFFGALAALVLLYRLRDDCPPAVGRSLAPDVSRAHALSRWFG